MLIKTFTDLKVNLTLKSDPMGQSYALTLNQIAPGFIIIPGVVGNTLGRH